MSIKWYSERGIFNSIVYFLDENQNYIPDFLKPLKILEENGDYEYTFLIEQSFSDFGDSDLVIIAENKQKSQKIVVFVEGKVKTCQGNFSIEKEFNSINDALEKEKTESMSSNLFVQLYYKYLLVHTKGKGNENDKPIFLKIDRKKKTKTGCRKIGKNGVVKKAFECVDNANDYYYVAILPDKNIDIDKFQKYIKKLELIPDYNKTLCYRWEDIETFFARKNVKKVLEVFEHNEGQIYKR